MEIVCAQKAPRVRISSSPPDIYNPLILQRVFSWQNFAEYTSSIAMTAASPRFPSSHDSNFRSLSRPTTCLIYQRGIRHFRITTSGLGLQDENPSLDFLKQKEPSSANSGGTPTKTPQRETARDNCILFMDLPCRNKNRSTCKRQSGTNFLTPRLPLLISLLPAFFS